MKLLPILAAAFILAGNSQATLAADPGAGVYKTIKKFNGTCVKAVYLDADILSDCVGPAVEIIDVDGNPIMAFKLSNDRTVMFIATKSTEEDRKRGKWTVSKVQMFNDRDTEPGDAVDAVCDLDPSNGDISVISCTGKIDGKTVAFTYDVSGPPETQDLESGGSTPLMFEYWDDLNGACKAYSVDNQVQDARTCSGYYHIGYKGGRVTLLFNLAGRFVTFSSAHDMVMTDGHGEMPVSYLYLNSARNPALGDCTTDGDWRSKATLVCDAATTVDSQTLLVHIEFLTNGLTPHKGGLGNQPKP